MMARLARVVIPGLPSKISRSYDSLGRLELVSLYVIEGEGTVLDNQIKYRRDDLGRVDKVWQEHDGSVDDDPESGESLYVQYTYDDSHTGGVFNNGARLESVIYPAGEIVYYDYTSTGDIDDLLNRVKRIRKTNVGGAILAEYAHNGTGRLAVADYPTPEVKLDYYQGTPGTYAGLDRFGRVKDQYWKGYNGTADVAQIKHGYDYASNRTWREDVVAAANSKKYDELYTYDGLHRLTNAKRGDLNVGKDGIDNEQFEHDWTLDALGNWTTFNESDDDDAPWELEQTRYHNEVNEIYRNGGNPITESPGPQWTDPLYDAAGNMTTGPSGVDPTVEHRYIYDAWNRLVEVTDAGDVTIATYRYNGLGQRIVKVLGPWAENTDTVHFYYNNRSQVLEERVGKLNATPADVVVANPLAQYVWHPYYIDALAVRYYDANTDGNSVDHYYTHDANFNVTAVVVVVDTTTTVLERYHYTPYGEVLMYEGDWTNEHTTSSIGNDILYTGRRLDPETGLYYYRARYYHAQLGRFVNRDVIGYDGSLGNLYEYAQDNPIITMDPYGLQAFRLERHHWFAQLGEKGQETVDKFCLPDANGNPKININDFTTPVLGSSKGTVHYTIHTTFMYNTQYMAVVNNTKPCNCCSFLKQVWGLMIANWTAANAWAVHKPPKGQYGHELTGPFPKLERFEDPAPKGKGVDMTGRFLQHIITECKLTREQLKEPSPLTYKIPGGIHLINFWVQFPELEVVVDPDAEKPKYRPYVFTPGPKKLEFNAARGAKAAAMFFLLRRLRIPVPKAVPKPAPVPLRPAA